MLGRASPRIRLTWATSSGTSTPSRGAREPPVAAGGLAAVPRERAVERVRGRVADLAGNRLDCGGGVLQPLRREVHATAREVRQRWLAPGPRHVPPLLSAVDGELTSHGHD